MTQTTNINKNVFLEKKLISRLVLFCLLFEEMQLREFMNLCKFI
jgi:hypothetical protein